MTTIATTEVTTNNSAIRARDFTPDTSDQLRDEWDLGKMRHLVDALQGVPVVVTVDRQTGHTLIGARLVRCYYGDGAFGGRVVIESTLSGGTVDRTNFGISKIGDTIVPLAQPAQSRNGGIKWDALTTYMREVTAAIKLAQAEHGKVEGRAWGRWSGKPGGRGVYVTYTPHTDNPAFASQWGTHWSGVVVDGRVVGH